MFGGLAGVAVVMFSAAQVACGKIPANTPASGGPDMGMKKPQFSLPHDVPKLPPGRFYRVKRENMEMRRATWVRADKYVGDHWREAAK